MAKIQKVSEITTADLAEYLRIGELSDGDSATLETLLDVAKSYISNYTGRTLEEMDSYGDFVIVVLILVQDMYDNRTMYVDNSSLNATVQSILGMHSVNLL